MKRHKLVAICLLICVALPVSAAPWVLRDADTAEAPTEVEVDALEALARSGDWELKKEFAAAHLYEKNAVYGCATLKYGHRCRAMAKHGRAGQKFLREILEASPNDSNRIAIGSFQEDYATSLLIALRPPYAPESEICREIVRYLELAVQNGEHCVARELESMAYWGICMEKNLERAKEYRALIPPRTGCPES